MSRPESAPLTPLAERIRNVRRSLGDPERGAFSSKLGLGKNTIAHYERGDRVPTAEVLAAYRDRLKVDLNWLVGGEGHMFLDGGARGNEPAPQNLMIVSADEHAALGARLLHLPLFDVEAAAGRGQPVHAEQKLGEVAFDPQFLRDRGATPEACTVIRANGDSMAPTIPDGSLLVVDHSQKSVAHGYITVIGIGDDLLVKRVRRRLDGTVELISDNQAYLPEVIGTDRLDQLRVVGRVVYFCRVP